MMRRRGARAGAALLALALLAGACGGDGGSADAEEPDTTDGAAADDGDPTDGEGDDGGAAGDAGVEEARQIVAEYTQNPTSIGVDTPVDGDIPSDKTIAFLSCGLPTCDNLGDQFEAAAAELGWTVDRYNAGLTPESINAAWSQVARELPDGVVASGYPRVLFEDSLQILADNDVPVVQCCINDEPVDGLTATLMKNNTVLFGETMAAWIVAEEGTDANTLWVTSSDFPILDELTQGFSDEYARLCPDCELEVLDTPSTEIAAGLPTTIVGALRSNPDINYLGLAIDGMVAGLDTALEDAGLSDIGIIGQGGDPINKQLIADGKQSASSPIPSYELMWLAADTLARVFVGDTSVDATEIIVPTMIYTPDNIGDPTDYEPFVADYQEQFKALWGR
ncbi:sugar ABC transporter substrate-binding protein [Nitriliruptoraceae bacterium ZYF776]|nr:sugar ABC transporter substrate-binding protein [Profundirhabdus halotolerans]